MMILCALFVGVTVACGIHEHSETHCCDFCHFGFLPWIQVGGVPSVAPPMPREWRLGLDPNSLVLNNGRIAPRGRAPPAC